MDTIPCDPIRKKRSTTDNAPSEDVFSDFLGDIFHTTSQHSSQVASTLLQYASLYGFSGIPPFQVSELKGALRRMANRKCADQHGIVVEVFKFGSNELHEALLGIYNTMLRTGCLEPRWQHTLFSMLPKSGDLSQASNWRPTAILDVTYKIFSRMLYGRLRGILEPQQSHDQCGFRAEYSVEDELVVLDTVVGTSLEFKVPMWFASLDLRKAFDRIEHGSLLETLRAQGVGEAYSALLATLYSNQTGSVGNGRTFQILRGVKQSDIISPLLFNAGLETAIRNWKGKLRHLGIAIDHGERLTNIRYADDLIIYANSLGELCYMVELLVCELEIVGLSLNTSKTNFFTTEALELPLIVEVANGMVEVLTQRTEHKYLGRHIPGDLQARSTVELDHRVAAAWGRFHKHRSRLMNRNVHISLRLKLFECVVTPTALFGMTAMPLTPGQLQQLDATRRRMLRSIAGWVRYPDEDWACTTRRVNSKLAAALSEYPLRPWSEQFACRQFNLMLRFTAKPQCWPTRAAKWDPSAPAHGEQVHFRMPGRPRRKWDDHLKDFSNNEFARKWFEITPQMWLAKRQDFISSVAVGS